jgi:hypothetical protein
MPYVIIKSSRLPSHDGYSGPSCERAGVEPGRVYDTLEEANVDVEKLRAVNSVGFVVWLPRTDAK